MCFASAELPVGNSDLGTNRRRVSGQLFTKDQVNLLVQVVIILNQYYVFWLADNDWRVARCLIYRTRF